MAVRYYVGETPSRPLVINLRDSSGEQLDLTGLTVTLEGDGLPAGTTTVTDATTGEVEYEFTAPFTEAGILEVRARLVSGSGDVDLTDPMEIPVYDDSTGTLIMTPAQVEGITGTVVTASNIARAQSMVSLAVGRDLSNPDVVASLTDNDLYLVRQAVAWQAEGIRTGKVNESYPTGAVSISSGDQSISFGSGGSSSDASLLAPLATLAVKRLSWMGWRSVRSTSMFASRGRYQSDSSLWTRM